MKMPIHPSPKTLRLLLLINLVVIVAALCLPTTVYADDCLSDPLNAADCMRTGGYRQVLVITFATLPTISVIIPNLLQAPTNVLPPILQDKLPPNVQPPQKPVPPQQSGPPPELVNEKGQVWYKPPWDQGGEYWVDREEYDSIQQHLREGYVWSDRWGWKPPEEINQLDRERDRRWKEFTSKEAGQRRHEQLKRDIQKDLENDPEYQRIQRELAEIKAKLDDIKRRGLQEDIAFYQRQAELYEAEERRWGYLEAGATAVKSAADAGIDTLAVITPGGNQIKYAYYFTSKAASTTAETGSVLKGVANGALEAGKSYLGDKTGQMANKTMGKIIDYTAEFGTSTVQKTIEKESLSEGLQQGVMSTGKKLLGDLINKVKVPGMDNTIKWETKAYQEIMNNPELKRQFLMQYGKNAGNKVTVDMLEYFYNQIK